MKKRIALRIGMLALAAFALVSFSSCEFLAELFRQLAQPYGDVVNAKTGEGVSGVTVTLTSKANSSTTFTTTTNSAGRFDWANETTSVDYGSYTLTASLSGYTFISKDVEVSGLAQSLGDILGFQPEDDKSIVFALLWNDSFADVDGYLTYPTTTPASEIMTTPYDTPATISGFVPSTGTMGTNRQRIYWNRKTTNGGSQTATKGTDVAYDFDKDGNGTNETFRAEMDRDDTDGSGPETITVRTFPVEILEDNTAGDKFAGGGSTLLDTRTAPDGWYWVGAMEYYVDAYSANSDLTRDSDPPANLADGSNGADVVLYVFQGSTILGEYRMPSETTITTGSVLRINMLWRYDDDGDIATTALDERYTEFYQFVPDIRVVNGTAGIRSVADGTILVEGRTGR